MHVLFTFITRSRRDSGLVRLAHLYFVPREKGNRGEKIVGIYFDAEDELFSLLVTEIETVIIWKYCSFVSTM